MRTKGSKVTGINCSVWRSPEERIDRMDKCGIDMEVLSLSASNVYFADRALSLDLTQKTNDLVTGLSRKYPDRFTGVAGLPMLDMGDGLGELHRAVECLGLRGIALGSNINGMRQTR